MLEACHCNRSCQKFSRLWFCSSLALNIRVETGWEIIEELIWGTSGYFSMLLLAFIRQMKIHFIVSFVYWGLQEKGQGNLLRSAIKCHVD